MGSAFFISASFRRVFHDLFAKLIFSAHNVDIYDAKKHNSGVLMSNLVWSNNMATNKKRITVSLTEDQYSTLETLAKEKGFSKSAILALALEDYSGKGSEQKK